MSEDAVSPVVAAMLILAVVVTFFAAWNAYYVPAMKAQSEIDHISKVESGFSRFSGDLMSAISLRQDITLSETIPLGGGDFTFDPVKSGGELKVWSAAPDAYLQVNWTNRTGPELDSPTVLSPDYHSSLVKFSYTPTNNFWQGQGYVWSFGNLFVNNAERNLIAPLNRASMDDIGFDDLAGSFIVFEPSVYTSSAGCSVITIRTVNITPEPHHDRVSGNGNSMLVLKSRIHRQPPVYNVTGISMSVPRPELIGGFRETLWENLNSSAQEIRTSCNNIESLETNDNQRWLQLKIAPSSNTTLLRVTTDITIGAY